MPKKILIADDDDSIIDLVAASCTAAGFSVVTCMTGSRVIDLLRRERPDAVVLDVMMPGIDGYSLQIQFDQDASLRSIPVIVITALPAARALFQGFPQVKQFVQKPFDVTELVKQLTTICGGT